MKKLQQNKSPKLFDFSGFKMQLLFSCHTQKLPSSLLCDSCVWLNNFPGTQNKRETFPKYFLSFYMYKTESSHLSHLQHARHTYCMIYP